MAIKYFFFLVLLFQTYLTCSQNSVDNLCRRSTEGTDFWFGFMENRNLSTFYVEITITSAEATSFTISIGNSEELYGTYSVNANSSCTIRISDWERVEATGSETIQDRGIHLESENPVNVYALNYDDNSADVAIIYPTESLGEEYFAMCYTPDVSNGNKNSEFLVVASENETKVEITPTKVTDQKQKAGTTFQITLNKGEVYQVQSENTANATGQGDLTGSHIEADKPIAFFSGVLSTRIPSGVCCYDHLYEQIPAIQSWGREYYTVPLKGRQKDRFRIMAAKDNTVVEMSGESSVTLNSGEFVEKEWSSPTQIYSNKQILVAQFSQSRDVDNANGDPFMIILSSTAQSRTDVTFEAYTSSNIISYYINIVALTNETSQIELDGSTIGTQFNVYSGDAEYSYAQIKTTAGTHHLSSSGDDGFLAYVYGFGNHESYGYGVGFNLDLILEITSDIDSQNDTIVLCNGESTTIEVPLYFDSYVWNTGDTTETITVGDEGYYIINASTFDGCELIDSVYVLTSDIEFDLQEELFEGCGNNDTFEVTANEGYSAYLWTNETDNTISEEATAILTEEGMYYITVYNSDGCPATDSVSVILPVTLALFEVDYAVAMEGQATISFTNLSENADYFNWNFDDGETSTIKNPKHTFSEVGEYIVSLYAESENGCYDSTQMTIKVIPFKTYVPNAFHPGSPIQENQTFMPVGIGADESRFHLVIFDRWGQVIFESKSTDNPWDGTMKNGQPAPVGNYVWVSHYYDIQGFKHDQKGQVVLVR